MKQKHWFKHSSNGHKKQEVKSHAFEQTVLSWKAPQFPHHEKSLLWFIVAGLVVFFLVMYGLRTDGWTFSVAILVFAGTYYLVHRHVPPTVDIKISKFGVKIGRHTFPFSHLKSFWIVYEPPFVKKLYLRMDSKLRPDLFISLEDADPAEVRQILSQYLNEFTGRHEPFSDTLVRLLKL